MKKLFALLAVGLSVSLGAAYAADAPAKTPQQQKMANCNKEAAGKKGDERKAFMKDCLSAKPAAAAAAPAAPASAPAAKSASAPASAAAAAAATATATPDKKVTQQDKMKACNKEAGEKKLKGDERKAFMKDCLSK